MTTTTADEAPAAPYAPRRRRRSGRRRRGGPRWLDFSIAATALVVSTASLLVARHQAQVMDRQLAASVWPAVRSSAGFSPADSAGGATIAFSLDNRGTGPARLQSHRVSYRGRPLRNMGDLLEALGQRDVADSADDGSDLRLRANATFVRGRVLGTGEHLDWLIFRLPADGGPRVQRLFEAAARAVREDFTSSVCYCSVLDECWVASTGSVEPARVPTCDAERRRAQYN